jgi:hypothetical protein
MDFGQQCAHGSGGDACKRGLMDEKRCVTFHQPLYLVQDVQVFLRLYLHVCIYVCISFSFLSW